MYFVQEFGQSTPDIRRSGRKITTLFKKRRVERDQLSNAEKQSSQYQPEKVNGISKEDDSDDSAVGEYIEVSW